MTKPREDTLPRAGVKLLVAGVASSVAAGLILAGILWAATDGGRALAASTGAAMGMVAMGLSQAVLTGTWKMRGVKSLAMGMVAYAVGIVGVILGMVWIDDQTSLDLFWAGIGVMTAAFAYIVAVAVTYPRLRILVLAPHDPPAESDEKQS